MTVTLEKLPDEPILLATLSGDVKLEEMEQIYAQTAELLQATHTRLYRITRIENNTTSFMDILKILQAAGKGKPGSSSDPNVTVIFLGSGSLIQFITNALRQPQFAGVKLPIFPTLEEALLYVRYDREHRSTQEMNKLMAEAKPSSPEESTAV